MTIAMQGSNVALNEVLTWPQALVGAISILVVLGLPQVFNFLSNRAVKKQVTNNGGSSMKDAVDRIETKQDKHNSLLDEHIKDASEKDRHVNERLVRIETLVDYVLKPEGDNSGTGT